tara:strand:+ start:530 stop:2602 length:2073 start_codon:yes stop_codon:yes gene_type:complete
MRFNNILTPPHLKEGYKIMPPMDKEKYPEMPGLEGPFTMMSGKVVYYDPKEGAYYDKDADMYMSYDEFQQHDNDYSNMKDERDEVKKEADELNIGAKGDRPYKGPPRQPKRGDPINVKSKGVDPKVLNMFLTNGVSENVAVRRDGKTLSKGEIAKLQRQGVLMKEDDEDDDLFKDDEFTAMDQEDDDEVNKHFDQDTVKKNALEALVDIAKTAKKYKGGVTDEQIEILGGLIQDMDLAGIEPEKYSAVNELFKVMATDKKADMTMIQPAYAQVKKIDENMNEGGTKSVIDMIANADNPEEMVMDLVDRGDAIGKFLYSELEQLATEAGTTFNNAESMPEDFVDELLANMGIEGYTFEGAPKSSPRPKPRPKTIPRPKARPTTNIGGMPGGSTRGIDPKDNYSPEDLKRLLMQSAMEDMNEGAFHEPGIEEGHSPHKKGTKKYKAHMAAIHANEDVNQQYADILKSKNQIKINAFLQGLDPATATRLTGGKAQTSKISSDGQSIGPSGDAYTHGKPGLSKQTIRMTKPVADRKYGESKRRVSMNQVCEAVKQTDPTYAVAMYVRTTLDPSYKTWDQVHEQVNHILSCINEGKTVNANTVMQLLSRKNLQEKADKGMMLKENIDSLRKIVRDKQYQTIKFSDGSMKVDLTTASMFIQVYEKQKPETQAKMDEMLLKKSGFLKLLDVMYSKMS